VQATERALSAKRNSNTPEEIQLMQMFSTTRKVEPAMPMAATPPAAPAPAPAPAPSSPAEIPHPGGTLSSGVSIKGHVKFSKELLIDCEVEGKIEATGRLTVGKNAQINGEIRTKSVIVDGTVDGNITAAERCELRAGCTVRGDIEAPRLVVDEAATFIGSAKIATPKPGA
jgi:cytoskeletal protein CcmA (bactofilin family)